MKYRQFGELDWKVSALGFGAMRFPTDEEGKIIEKEAISMMRYAFDKGVNYVDTAWPYHGGQSERVVAQAIQDGYRKKVKVATKLPSWEIKEYSDMDKYLDKQLDKLAVDKIDFYLLHALNEASWKKYKKLDVFSWIEKIKQEGKIEHLGFSFHGDYQTFIQIINDYSEWEFCQIQYNYLDRHFQAGEKGLKYAVQKGIPVIVMEPLRGGQLAKNPPDEVKEIMEEADIKRSPADWALQWLWNQPEVTMVLSGMSTKKEVEENIESASNSGENSLTDKELEIIDRIAEKFRGPIQCTKWGYCLPCPSGVEIPKNFSLYNEAHLYDNYQKKKEAYFKLDEEKRASACVACGKCEEVCPQNLEIIDLMEEVVSYFRN